MMNQLRAATAAVAAEHGFSGVVRVSLVDEGLLALSTTARSLLADDLPQIDDRVTVEHLWPASSSSRSWWSA